MTIAASQSNQYIWNEYEAPRWPLGDATSDEEEEEEGTSNGDNKESHSFTLRHLKQGATGAVRTWPVAEVMLDYLVRYGGLSLPVNNSINAPALDLTLPSPSRKQLLESMQEQQDTPSCYNILELGAGSGYLGIGLALSLNANALACRARILCTDMDKNTIKNMRYNLTSRKLNKTVRVQSLAWGEESLDQPKFLQALRTLFQTKSDADDVDPISLLTHVIGSDVHYGETTLEPLSSVIAAIKLRNPQVNVSLMMKERTPDTMVQLQSRIEDKTTTKLPGFTVSLRDVLHEHLTTVKLLEC